MSVRWEDMTVAELRQYAREHGITLSAGINKQGIVERITAYEGEQVQMDVPAAEPEPVPEQQQRPVRRASIIADDDDESRDMGYGMGSYVRPQTERPRYSSDPVRPQQTAAAPGQRADVLSTISSKAPAFHIDSGTKAWHNPRSFQPNNYHQPSPQTPRIVEPARTQIPARPADPRAAAAPRPAAPVQRFGPAEAAHPAEAAPQHPEAPAAEPMPAAEPQPRLSYQYARTTVQPAALRDYQSLGKPSVNELLAQDESEDLEGVCVLLKDGTAFLYADDNLDDESIVCLTAAQVRRFQLRTGDRVSGKIRARRDGDKYRFMLYVTGVNAIPVDDIKNRTSMESLHVIVPAKRLLSLPLRTETGERGDAASTPLLYGHRAYALAGRAETLKLACGLGRQIQESKPNARVLMLAVQNAPEDVALARAAAHWPLWSADPAAPEDKQCQVVRLAASCAARLAEQKTDAVLLVSCPNLPAPSEEKLYEELLRLFAGGRALKEGGSVSVVLICGEAPDARFERTASERLTLMPDGDDGVFALNGTVSGRAFQIFV